MALKVNRASPALYICILSSSDQQALQFPQRTHPAGLIDREAFRNRKKAQRANLKSILFYENI